MKNPDEIPAISVQEHLKITVSDNYITSNAQTQQKTVVTTVVMSQRVK